MPKGIDKLKAITASNKSGSITVVEAKEILDQIAMTDDLQTRFEAAAKSRETPLPQYVVAVRGLTKLSRSN